VSITESAPASTPAVESYGAPRNAALLRLLSRYGTVGALVAMFVGFAIAYPSTFATSSNFVDILSQVALAGIIACGVTVALVAGEYDLSIGYVASFAGVLVTGFMVRQGMPMVVAILLVLVICAGIGLINGLIVAKAGVNSFIATLGIGTMVVGANFAYNSGVAVSSGLPSSFLDLSFNRVATIPLPVYIMVGVAVLLWVVLNRSVFGNHAQAVGGNAVAARLAGIRVDRTRIGALVISAVCAGAGGILLAAKLGSGQTTAGDSFLLSAFAAAFIGSVALRDGEFHIVGTIIGVLTVGVGLNGLAIAGAPTWSQYLFNGGLLVVAVAISTISKRLTSR
jgi:ribose transport system permease protein